MLLTDERARKHNTWFGCSLIYWQSSLTLNLSKNYNAQRDHEIREVYDVAGFSSISPSVCLFGNEFNCMITCISEANHVMNLNNLNSQEQHKSEFMY